MPVVNHLASFPNTRQRPRKPTQDADTYSLLVSENTLIGVLDTSLPAYDDTDSANRGLVTTLGNTFVNERNQNRTYITLRNTDPSQAIMYGYEDKVDLATEGQLLKAGDAVDLESPEAIFVTSTSGIDPSSINIDFGIG